MADERMDGTIKKPATKISQADLDNFAKEVFKKMSSEKIPPLPNYYELYFETLLQDKPFDFRKEVADQLGAQGATGDEQRMLIEMKLKDGFSSVKEILQNVAIIYKNLLSSIDTSNKRAEEARALNNPVSIKNFATTLSADSEIFAAFVSKQALVLKDLYTKTAVIVKEIETESIFDAKYGVYNKRYIVKQIEKEQKLIAKFGHSTTLLLIALKNDVVTKIGTEKGITLVNKTMSKLFLKTSRRSDIVAYFSGGVFAMLLKHTDIKNAMRTSERLADMMGSTNFFLGDREIELNISTSITAIKMDIECNDLIESAIAVLKECNEDDSGKAYMINEI
jgi:diguanylate cyclase